MDQDERTFKVGLDIDDVMRGFARPFHAWYNKKHGTSYRYEDMINYDFNNIPIDYATLLVEFDHFYETHDFLSIPPIRVAAKHVKRLVAEGIEPHAITARPAHLEEHTIEYLNAHHPDLFGTRIYVAHSGPSATLKALYCLEKNIPVLVDDAPRNAFAAAEHGIKVFLVPRRWNAHVRHELIERPRSWSDIADRILRIRDASFAASNR